MSEKVFFTITDDHDLSRTTSLRDEARQAILAGFVVNQVTKQQIESGPTSITIIVQTLILDSNSI